MKVCVRVRLSGISFHAILVVVVCICILGSIGSFCYLHWRRIQTNLCLGKTYPQRSFQLFQCSSNDALSEILYVPCVYYAHYTLCSYEVMQRKRMFYV